MDQQTIDKMAKGLKITGAVFFVVVLGLLVWSLFRPAVTTGPMPDPWEDQVKQADAGK